MMRAVSRHVLGASSVLLLLPSSSSSGFGCSSTASRTKRTALSASFGRSSFSFSPASVHSFTSLSARCRAAKGKLGIGRGSLVANPSLHKADAAKNCQRQQRNRHGQHEPLE